MSLLMTFRVAFKALGRNKMRTALTMLGMIIGVAAVITMVALGTGAQRSIEQQIAAAGTNLIIVNSGNWTVGGVRQGQGASTTLTVDDAEAIRREVAGVEYLAAGVNTDRKWWPATRTGRLAFRGPTLIFPSCDRGRSGTGPSSRLTTSRALRRLRCSDRS